MSGVPLDPMSVYYARFEARSAPSKILLYYSRRAAPNQEHLVPGGYWVDGMRTVADTGRRQSIDILITKKGERDVAKPEAKPGGSSEGMPSTYPGYAPSPSGKTPYPGYGPGSYPGGPAGPVPGRPVGQVPDKAERNFQTDLVVEILCVEVENPVDKEAAKGTAKEAAKGDAPRKPAKKADPFD